VVRLLSIAPVMQDTSTLLVSSSRAGQSWRRRIRSTIPSIHNFRIGRSISVRFNDSNIWYQWLDTSPLLLLQRSRRCWSFPLRQRSRCCGDKQVRAALSGCARYLFIINHSLRCRNGETPLGYAMSHHTSAWTGAVSSMRAIRQVCSIQ
jgi:hypothetical protein